MASSAVGLARSAMEHALEYAKTRVQFGMPIIMNQSIMFMLATWPGISTPPGCWPGCGARRSDCHPGGDHGLLPRAPGALQGAAPPP
ncbi:MAG: acyl-CoA dehydrogenase family protein [Eubacteriales bacterium]